ncbi:MAG: AAA family ATPase [Gordonia sp. (in: high G+C Gram-positive bacteria)]|uniref:AAA family ATPase n=1 Tax=Gordonia sp. (in: high G+C Gram-positive bacteria) TaxID=84139 RepID=UPI0039E661AD
MRVHGESGPGYTPPAASHTVFVGREDERSRIRRLLTHPDRPVLVLTGPAGIGKTRLAREVAEADAGRLATYWTQADPSTRDVPFGIFEKWADPARSDPLQRFSELLTTFTDRTQPTLLVVDDVHLADDLSMFLIHQLAGGSATRLMLTLRSGEELGPAVSEVLALGNVERIELARFTRAEVAQFLAAGGRSPDERSATELWRRSGGNPLFLTTLVATGGDPRTVSDDLRSTVESMLNRDAGLCRLIDVLAEAESLPLAALTRLIGTVAIETAESRGLITVVPGGGWTTRLAHPLYGEVHRESLSPDDRLRIRTEIVEAVGDDPLIRSDYGHTLRMAVLAAGTSTGNEARATGVPAAANRDSVLVHGAEAALSVLDMPLAASLAGKVDEAGEQHTYARIIYGYALAAFGDQKTSEEVLDGLAAQTGDPETLETIALMRTGGSLWVENDPAPLRTLGEDPATSEETRRSVAGFLTAISGDAAASVAAMPDDPPRPPYRTPIDRHGVAGLIAALGRVTATSALGDHPGLLTSIQAAFEQLEGSAMAASQQTQLGAAMVLALSLSGDVPATRDAVGRLAPRLAPFPGISQFCLSGLRSITEMATGEVRRALDLARDAVDGFDDAGAPPFIWYPACLAYTEAAAAGGDGRTARRLLSRLSKHPNHGFGYLEPRVEVCRAWCAAGRPEEAVARLLAATDAAQARQRYGVAAYCLQTALRFGAANAGERAARLLAAAPSMPRIVTVDRHARALEAGDPHLLLAVSQEYLDNGDSASFADASAQAATGLFRTGDGQTGFDALDRALTQAAAIGLDSPAIRAADRASGLSERQRTIVALVRRGVSNRGIAERLSVSVRTVEGHVYRASQVLGAPIRRGREPFPAQHRRE